MADEIVAKYKIDVAEASKNLADLANASTKASDAMAKAGKVATDSFLAGSNGAKRLETELARQPKTLAEMELKLRNLKELLRDDTRIGTEGFKQVTKAIKETESAIDKANGKLKETGKEGTSLIGTFKNLAGAIGIAFGIQQIISFGKEAVQLAAKAEGVERAFARIGSPALLEGLRAATRGTVTDLVLMQNAVKADNFKIPLEQLGTLFQFAQSRARATGESVDYLVDSLILGIGRKSIPILDNLGISAVELKEKLGDTAKSAATIGDVAAAVGKIATESLQKTGIEADTTADKIAQLSTAWTNFKTNVGAGIIGFAANAANELGLLQADSKAVMEAISKLSEASTLSILRQIEAQKKIVADARETFDKASEDRLLKQGFDEIYAAAKKNSIVQSDILEEMERILKVRQQEILAANELEAVTADQLEAEKKRFELASKDGGEIRNVFFLTAAIKDLNDTINDEFTAREAIMPLIKQRTELQKELTKLTEEEATGINLLNKQLAELKKELDSAEVGGEGFWDVLDRIEKKTKELNDAAAMTRLAQALIPDTETESKSLLDRIKAENDAEHQAYLDKMKSREEFDDWLKEQDERRFDAILEDLEKQKQAKLKAQEEDREATLQTLDLTLQISGLISQAQQAATDNELAMLETSLAAGQITREEYDRKRREILKRQAQDDKAVALFEAVVNTAAAVVKALPDYSAAIIAGILGAAQIAIIAAQPIPSFAKGVIGLQGEGTETSDSIHARLSKGESVMTAKETREHLPILTAIRKGTIEKLIQDSYVTPAINAALLNGFGDIGKSAQLNGLTANLKDHNIIAALDRVRQSNTYGLAMLAEEMRKGKRQNRGGYA